MTLVVDSCFHLLDRADNSIDLDCQGKDGHTLLHSASAMGSEDLVTYLIDKGASVNAVYTNKVGSIPCLFDYILYQCCLSVTYLCISNKSFR